MAVEDHPIEYGDFEGIIPQGEYGGGTVMLWDHGAQERAAIPSAEDCKTAVSSSLFMARSFQGGWMLVRKGGREHWRRSVSDIGSYSKESETNSRKTKDDVGQKAAERDFGRDLDEIASQARPHMGAGNGGFRTLRRVAKRQQREPSTRPCARRGRPQTGPLLLSRRPRHAKAKKPYRITAQK